MKNIKTFAQLFEDDNNLGIIKVLPFNKEQYAEFKKYSGEIGTGWDPARSETTYNQYTGSYGDFYIIGDKFLAQISGESPADIKIIHASNKNDNYYRGERALDEILKSLNCSSTILKLSIWVSMLIKNTTSEADLSQEEIEKLLNDNPQEAFRLLSIIRKYSPKSWEKFDGDTRHVADDIASLGDLGF